MSGSRFIPDGLRGRLLSVFHGRWIPDAHEPARKTSTDLGVRLVMRVGIGAGDATFEDGAWFGAPVFEASRLCMGADCGRSLSPTWRGCLRDRVLNARTPS